MASINSSFDRIIQVTAILSGSYLSGSMMTISLIAFPALIHSTTSPTHLLQHWVSMFRHGHRIHPTMAAATLSVYLYAAYRQHSLNRNWSRWVIAGVVTILMTPFTWFVLLPTNRVIMGLADGSQDRGSGVGDTGVVGIEEVRGLVRKWSALHLVRSFFPLIGAVLGFREMLAG
ncbi:hypothetical protein BJY04DRAFT_217394 [Aspergillus karnatakaensis]|uniref:DUF1772 domain-containing protein n=1 Tax=Aspergillus karnatakaensis TaxID=1810916 RepID=UPI003CCDCCE7